MGTHTKIFLLLIVISVGIATLVHREPNVSYHFVEYIQNASLELQLRYHLYNEMMSRGFTYSDFRLFADRKEGVIKCESNWIQSKNGKTVVSNGNTGLGQINESAHKKTYTKMGLDMHNPFDNLTFVVYLYDRDGIAPWKTWSGHCWMGLYKKLKTSR